MCNKKEMTSIYKLIVLSTPKFQRDLGQILSGKMKYKTLDNRIIDFEDFSEVAFVGSEGRNKPLRLHQPRAR